MQILQIKPSSPLLIKIPTNLKHSLTLSNLTLHPVCIYIIPIHPSAISITPQSTIIDAFQQLNLQLIIHWHQQITVPFKTKIRVYIWQNYDDITDLRMIQQVMFNKQTDGNCLMFEEITVCFQLDAKAYLQSIGISQPKYYFARRVILPNNQNIPITDLITQKLFENCKKIGKVKSIYTYPSQFVIQFQQMFDVISAFIEMRDQNDNMVIFAIGCLAPVGNCLVCPDSIDLTGYKRTTILNKQPIKQTKTTIQNHHHIHNPIPNNPFSTHNTNKLKTKQSFIAITTTKDRRRNKSQQTIRIPVIQQEDDQQQHITQQKSTMIDLDWLKNYRKNSNNRSAQNYEIKHKKQYSQTVVQLTKKVLNTIISDDKQPKIYLLLRDSILIFDAKNNTNKWAIKFEPIDQQNIHLPTPMLLVKQQIIFGNQSYLYWINLNGYESVWKYVQRKQIYCLEIIQELNILIVGGKNFSKLSYLGKSTNRCNFKVYSGGKTGKHNHLFTYDVPNCHGDNVIQLKYITTKPTGTKLLMVLTNVGRIAFIRVHAYNEFQMYSLLQCQQIGIQQLVSIKYIPYTGHIVCLQKLDAQNYCLKNLKIACSYEKVELSTQSLKLPVTNYSPQSFRTGYQHTTYNKSWITIKQKNGQNLIFWFDSKHPQLLEQNKNVKATYIINNGFILQEKTSIRCKLLKQNYI